MPCFHPITAWQRGAGAPLSFDQPVGTMLQVPCNQCIGCRLERSRQWAARCMHESQLHEDNCFITLTYSDENLPPHGSLLKSDFQKFCKRVRKHMHPFRFFHCGEYGEQLARPHYHACIFGLSFPPSRIHSERDGIKLLESDLLTKLWGLGHATVGALTFESAAYVARYVMKKVTGDAADEHYTRISNYGEVVKLEPEYVTMSRRPGIGFEWFRKFNKEVFPSDEVIVRGFPSRPPRYYDNLLAVSSPDLHESVKSKRVAEIGTHAEDLTPARLRDREEVCAARVALLKRSLSE